MDEIGPMRRFLLEGDVTKTTLTGEIETLQALFASLLQCIAMFSRIRVRVTLVIICCDLLPELLMLVPYVVTGKCEVENSGESEMIG